MLRDDGYLLDILNAAQIAVDYASELSWEEFIKDMRTQDAVLRRLEIVGEAARRVSDLTRDKYPSLPWISMIGMRNFMIHEYDSVDLSIVWDTIKYDLPSLISVLKGIVPPEK
ncbi:MAG: DUF86 domain-containing protein [Chloroflexota bacterium]|nr:DUF86 domain-containing protein [Chloroflexota bacterium]